MKKITIQEVGPRDGFQNVNEYIKLENKLEIIEGIIDSGIKDIQITSFVSPKAIPQMKDSEILAKILIEKYSTINFFVLVPNLYGAKIADKLGIKAISYVVSVSESHNIKNINKTHRESMDEFIKIRKAFPNMKITLDLATTFGCPFEGKFSIDKPIQLIRDYYEAGIDELNLCDTIGIADPNQVRDLIKNINTLFDLPLSIHIHDTRNMGMVNTLVAIENGITKVQSTLGGLGGCPFAPGASGNLSTEDFVYMLNQMNYDTGIDFDKLLYIAKKEKELIPTGIYSGHHINIP